jgi:hypothetical protein
MERDFVAVEQLSKSLPGRGICNDDGDPLRRRE